MSKTAKPAKPVKSANAAPARADAAAPQVKKVVLAYSGGLDTSIILKWLQDEYHCEVVTFTADIGQGEEIEPARAKAIKMGIKPENIFIEDLREEFVRDFVFPMFRANALYEGEYLLGTSIARPLIAKRLIEIAKKTKGDAISHGATGKGNDQVRFELGAYALMPGVKVIAPWREWDLLSRAQVLTKLNELGGKHGIGRLDKVENRYVGMKSRGCYETPGGTIMLTGHRAIESITLDREVLSLKDDLMPRYARLIYNGYWFSPERELLQGLIDASQATVNGKVKLKLYKGTIMCVGRESATDSLFDAKISTFDDDGGAYNQADAAGFIKLNALRLRIGANVQAQREATAKVKADKAAARKTAAKKKPAVAAKKAAAKKVAAPKAA
jgi:argininosuccinate synthase